jgi:hypothetical protein
MTTAPLSASILYRNQQNALDLLEEKVKEWAELAARNDRLSREAAGLLTQMVLICLRSPGLMRDLWEWAKAEELAGRLRDRQQAGEELREELQGWLELVAVFREAAKRAEAESYPIRGADELETAEEQLGAILQDVNETWPPLERGAPPPLSYDELHGLADRFPPPAPWHEEEQPNAAALKVFEEIDEIRKGITPRIDTKDYLSEARSGAMYGFGDDSGYGGRDF